MVFGFNPLSMRGRGKIQPYSVECGRFQRQVFESASGLTYLGEKFKPVTLIYSCRL